MSITRGRVRAEMRWRRIDAPHGGRPVAADAPLVSCATAVNCLQPSFPTNCPSFSSLLLYYLTLLASGTHLLRAV